MNKHVIELNGKRYDALSGAFLGTSIPVTTKANVAKPTVKPISNHSKSLEKALVLAQQPAVKIKPSVIIKPSLSDITAPKTAAKATSHVIKVQVNSKPPAPIVVAAPAKVAKPARAHSVKAFATKHPEHSKTLMRHMVHKPHTVIKPAIKPQAPVAMAPASANALVSKHSAHSVDPDRMIRAQHHSRHTAVARFAHQHHKAGHQPHLVAPIVVQPAPVSLTHNLAQQANKAVDIFEAAIAKATSHQQPAHRAGRSQRRKLLNGLATGGAFLVIASFLAILNMPNIQLRVASVQAGFRANIPSYAPVGYALTGGVKRTGNTVSMVFRAGENSYTVTQQPSNWNNDTLLDNTLALQNDHQTIQAAGRTVFIYDKSNAVWVTGNVRYDVIGNAPLDYNDLSHLATSL